MDNQCKEVHRLTDVVLLGYHAEWHWVANPQEGTVDQITDLRAKTIRLMK